MRRVGVPLVVFALVAAISLVLSPATASTPVAPPGSDAGANADAETEAAVARLYRAAFNRPADATGLDYWTEQHRQGLGLNDVSELFVASREFQLRYGNVDDPAFVDLVYRNVLGRDPDDAGRNYWVAQLGDGHRRGTILNGFAQSTEFINITSAEAVEPPPPFPDRILMIGDSIFHGIKLLELPVGSAELTFLTEEGRQASALPELLAAARAEGLLESVDVIVIHLGTNGWLPEYDELFRTELNALGSRPIFMVNTEVARPWETAANEGLAAIAASYDHVQLIDWNDAVAGNPSWMRSDGIHPNRTGLTELARLVADSIAQSYASNP